MSFSERSSNMTWIGRLRTSGLVSSIAAVSLLLAGHAAGQTFSNGSNSITVSGTYGYGVGSTVPVSGISATVAGISVTFNNLSVTGPNGGGLNSLSMVLVPPSGSGLTAFDLLGGSCNSANATFTLSDTGPFGTDASASDDMAPSVACPTAFSGTYLPADYYANYQTEYFNKSGSAGPSTFNTAGIGNSVCENLESNLTCGNYSFVTAFGLPTGGSVFNGTWTLYIANQDSTGEYTPSGSLGSWSITFTTAAATPSTTSLSTSNDGETLSPPVYTNGNVNGGGTVGTPVTFTATVYSGGSPITGGGTVSFYDSTGTTAGSGTALGSPVAVSGSGEAQTIYTFTRSQEGTRTISAVYSGDSDYTTSTSPLVTELTVNHPYSPSAGTYCNGPVTIENNSAGGSRGTGGSPYPSQLILGGLSGTIQDVTVTLNGLQSESPLDNGFMVESPTGKAFEFMSWVDGDGGSSNYPPTLTNLNLTLSDSGSTNLRDNSPDTAGSVDCSSAPCLPTDEYPEFTNLDSDTFPAPASPFSAPALIDKPYAAGSSTFASEFGGVNPNGTWLLYLNNWAAESPASGGTYGQLNEWCLNFTLQTGADATTTTVSGQPNAATIASGTTASVNLTANVTDSSNSGVTVNSGTVSFVDGATNLGSGSVSSGVATLSNVALTEGTHQIVATYSGTDSGSPQFGISSGTFDERVDKATTIPSSATGTGPYTYCNTGSITAPGGNYDSGAASPYPSNITVSGLPGTVNAATVLLNGFTTRDQGDLMSLLVGPGGNNLDFFSLTGSNVGTAPSPFNLTFSDTASDIVRENLSSSGTFLPTSENTSIAYPQCAPNATLCASESVGPPLASSPFTPTNKATTAGTGILGNANEAGVFGGTTASTYSGNGTWSLYIDDGGPTGDGEVTNINNGWCVSLTVNLPTISFTGPAPSAFLQNGTGSLPAIVVSNNGINGANAAGPIGDPTQTTANAMTVVDTLPNGIAFTGATGTDWNCSASGQLVTCTNQDTVAPGANYSALTINVSVSSTVSGAIGNNTVSVSDAEAVNAPAQQSAGVSIDVAPAFTSATGSTFTVGTNGSFPVTATGYPAPSLSTTSTLPNGVTFTDNGNGMGTLAGTPAGGSGGAYPIALTAANGTTNATQNFTLTVDQAPVITSNPLSQTVTTGNAATFTAAANGYPAPTVQWQVSTDGGVDFSNIPGATSTTLSFITDLSESGDEYQAVFLNSTNNAVSTPATLTVVLPQEQLTTAANPAAGGTVSPTSGGLYNQGTSVPITATTNTGYYFVNWTSSPDSVASRTSANTSIPMNAAESVTANFGVNLVVTTAADDSPANATNCTPQATPGSNTVDSACSLRDALALAANTGAANITFASASGQLFSAAQTITLANGSLSIPTNTSIAGPTSGSGASVTNLVTVSGAQSYTVFSVNLGNTAAISNLIVTDGYSASSGGGISNEGALTLSGMTISNSSASSGGGVWSDYHEGIPSSLTVTNCTISGNSASQFGGGIDTTGNLVFVGVTVTNSIIADNSAFEGGGIANESGQMTITGSSITENSVTSGGGGIANYGTLTITNSTLSGDSTTGEGSRGGGINNVVAGSSLTVTNSTISGNAVGGGVSYGGGISNEGTLNLSNSIVAGNEGAFGFPDIRNDQTYNDNGGNVANTSSSSTTVVTGLGPLGNYGGSTETLVPLAQSPAICAGTLANATAAGITADQRGFPFDPTCAAGSIDAGAAQTGTVILTAGNISFGSTTVDTWSASQWVSVINKGSAPVTITGVNLSGANASQFDVGNTCGSTLAAGANCFVHVHFQPTVTGPAMASISITDSADTTTQTIALSGTGIAPASSLVLSLNSLEFASENVGASTSEQTVTVTNTGGAAISFTSIVVGGANASSFIFANNCGSSLAAGAMCSVHGHFAPTAVGALTASVTLTDSDTSSPQTITLSGTGVQPVVTLSTHALTYGSVTENTPSGSQSVTLTNNGTAALTITSIAVTGANAADFTFANNCGTSLAIGASCTIHGHFTPSTLAAESAAVTITDNAPDSPESISLSGTGVAATGQVTLSSTNLLPGSTPTNLVYGSVNVGVWSATQTVIMTNTGSTTLSISSIVLGGPNANQFAFGNTCGATLAVGATCLIQGHFAPTTTGPMSATVTITDSDSTSPQTIALSGTGVTPAITLSASSLSYAPTTVGTASGSQSVKVTNAGSAVLPISSIAVTGADAASFVFANDCGASLGVGGSCTIHGHFAPTATGTMTAAVTITYSAAGSPINIALSGTGQ